ncbi:MAG: hypothetical protein RR182_08990 [Alistipes sp.]
MKNNSSPTGEGYDAPTVEILSVNIEIGFAGSTEMMKPDEEQNPF